MYDQGPGIMHQKYSPMASGRPIIRFNWKPLLAAVQSCAENYMGTPHLWCHEFETTGSWYEKCQEKKISRLVSKVDHYRILHSSHHYFSTWSAVSLLKKQTKRNNNTTTTKKNYKATTNTIL